MACATALAPTGSDVPARHGVSDRCSSVAISGRFQTGDWNVPARRSLLIVGLSNPLSFPQLITRVASTTVETTAMPPINADRYTAHIEMDGDDTTTCIATATSMGS